MKFTKETLTRIIAEEIENYLNEQDDDKGLRASPEKIKRALAKLVAMGGDEDLGDTYTPLPAGPEKEFPGSPEDIPGSIGFERMDDDEDEATPVAPTEIKPELARTPIGRKPRKSPMTRFINKK
jgi:hypothetical protein